MEILLIGLLLLNLKMGVNKSKGENISWIEIQMESES